MRAQEADVTIESLLTQGWEVVGYTVWADRSLILFRNKAFNHLAQCSVLYDVLRRPRIATYCIVVR